LADGRDPRQQGLKHIQNTLDPQWFEAPMGEIHDNKD